LLVLVVFSIAASAGDLNDLAIECSTHESSLSDAWASSCEREGTDLGQGWWSTDSTSGSRRRGAESRRRYWSTYTATACPSGTDSTNWIKSVEVGNKNDQSIRQLTVSTVGDATVRSRDDDDKVPGTAAAMSLHNDQLDKWLNGDYCHTDSQSMQSEYNFGGSLTRDRFWKLTGEDDCYAMASYQEVKQHDNEAFQQVPVDNVDKFLKEVHLRAVKFSVCKGTTCATARIAMDCWLKKTDNNWEQCRRHNNSGFLAALMSRT